MFFFYLEPIVFFSSSMIKVQESMRHPISISLTISRTGFDLSDQTLLTCFIIPTGNATPGIDYVIDDLNAITIPPRASEINISIVILNDTLVEGNEGFRIQMTEPYYGKMATPNTMEVIIVDAEKGTIMNICIYKIPLVIVLGMASAGGIAPMFCLL